MNLDLTRKKLDCALHRGRARGLVPDSSRYHCHCEDGLWIHRGGFFFLTDLVIEGYRSKVYSSRIATIEKVLRTDIAAATALEYGLCNMAYYPNHVEHSQTSDAMFAIGLEYYRKMLP